MSLDAWITLGVVLVAVALLATERLPPAFTLLAAVTVLVVVHVLQIPDAFAGFSNPAPLTVAALYVLAAAVEKTRALERLATRLLGFGDADESSGRAALLRVTLPTAVASSFLNNTPIVAMAAPTVVGWARRTGRSPSPFLIPISFAAILGGMVTLVGTSTNLVVSGLLAQAGLGSLGLFEIGKVGLPVAVAGLALLVVAIPILLPARMAPSERVEADAREFTVGAVVLPQGPLVGKTVTEAGLRNLQGVFLAEIERDGTRLAPVSPHETLHGADHLTFAGNVNRILDLQSLPGLASAEQDHLPAAGAAPQRRLYEAVVGEGSPLAGSTLKEIGFRSRYGAAVLALHRAGTRIQTKLGGESLRAGDVLLVVSDPSFRERSLGRRDFITVAPLDGEPPGRSANGWIVGVLTAGMFVLVAAGVLDVLTAALLVGFGVVAARVLTPGEAREAVDLNIVVMIAASFGLGTAMSQSGLAAHVASGIVGALGGLGATGLLVGVLLATMLLTEVITNNAAAVLMFPIAISTAQHAGLQPRPFAIAVAVGASCSFLTPIGYQTNTMVYGMGGYRFSDFLRVGLPLALLTVVIAALVIPLGWSLR